MYITKIISIINRLNYIDFEIMKTLWIIIIIAQWQILFVNFVLERDSPWKFAHSYWTAHWSSKCHRLYYKLPYSKFHLNKIAPEIWHCVLPLIKFCLIICLPKKDTCPSVADRINKWWMTFQFSRLSWNYWFLWT